MYHGIADGEKKVMGKKSRSKEYVNGRKPVIVKPLSEF
jgi:hypothetical protein